MFSNDISTVGQCLVQTKKHLEAHDLFYGHGTDNAWDEACWLVETVLKRHGLDEVTEQTLLKDTHLHEISLILSRRVKEKQPLGYLINEAWFAGLPFYVDEQVLIPRSPIAELLLNAYEPLVTKAPQRILDLCTGSGCIGIASALVFPEASVDLADLSKGALDVAEKNIQKHALSARVKTIHSDLFESLEQTYDLIVSNPPYVSQEEYEALPEEYLKEPEMGLVSLDNGLAIPTQILSNAANYLNDDGVLILEVGYSWQALAEALPQFPFLWLEFEFGGEGICCLSKQQILEGNARSSKTSEP